ncbi:uncharacterized protein [Procambarus clarkii]|uniref:uncharacterized protein n=1 Tax=Procambarus clarkii TaxID=6728 RepID=UPI003744A863
MASLINAYAPTLISSSEAKGEFYDDLGLTLRDIPQQEPVFFLGDFNARVGSDHSSWPSYLDQFGKMHESGQRLLEFWCRHDPCIIISFFDTKPQHKEYSPALTSCEEGRAREDQCALGSDWGRPPSSPLPNRSVEHQLVALKVSVSIVTDRVKDRVEPIPILSRVTTAISTFGKRQNKSADWFEAIAEELLPLVEEKRGALSSYKNLPSERNLQALRTARSRVQQTVRCCANDYWLRLCSSIQTAATVGNIGGMYEGIKQATGPTQNRTAPLKSATGEIIKDRDQQMNRWVEHYSELYSRKNLVSVEALDTIKFLPIMEELDLEPTVEERSTTDMVFSLRQLQEKCRRQRNTLYIAFIDLTMAFDLTKSSALAEIPTLIYKKNSKSLAHAIALLYKSLELQTFPDILKKSESNPSP